MITSIEITKEKGIVITGDDEDDLPPIAKHFLREKVFSLIFGSRKFALLRKIECGLDIKEKIKKPYISTKHSVIKNKKYNIKNIGIV